ncbi:MAG TPA: glycosyltransferase [Burkholderiales bacterium]
MRERSGGLFVGPPTAESGIGILREALEIFPGARVEVARRQDEIQQRMRAAAYLVLPSLSYEAGPPRALVDAFACGLPVIASRLAGLAEIIEPGRNGLLFEPGSAHDLARRLAWAEAFPGKMRQMGQCAQADYHARLVADWGWQRLYGERRRQAREKWGRTPF